MKATKYKGKSFTVRERASYGHPTWQVGQDVCADASYYTRDFAVRCMEKFIKRGMVPSFEDGASDPRGRLSEEAMAAFFACHPVD